jgi:hypothetical protein
LRVLLRGKTNMKSQIIHADGVGLYLHEVGLTGMVAVEATDLAIFLEYVQAGSVRKQIFGDWKNSFEEGIGLDWVFEMDYPTLRFWRMKRDTQDDGSLAQVFESKPVKRTRPSPNLGTLLAPGRVFLLERGLLRFLQRTKKPRAPGLLLAMAKVSEVFRAPDFDQTILEFSPEETFFEAPYLEPGEPELEPLHSPEEQRFQYQVYQDLLRNLHDFDGSPLQDLALEVAEVTLGRPLEKFREFLKARDLVNIKKEMPPFPKLSAPLKV